MLFCQTLTPLSSALLTQDNPAYLTVQQIIDTAWLSLFFFFSLRWLSKHPTKVKWGRGLCFVWRKMTLPLLPAPLITAIITQEGKTGELYPRMLTRTHTHSNNWWGNRDERHCREGEIKERARVRSHFCVRVIVCTHIPLLWGPAVWRWWRGGPHAPAGSWPGKRRCGPHWRALQTGPLHIYLHEHTQRGKRVFS